MSKFIEFAEETTSQTDMEFKIETHHQNSL